MLTTDCKRKRDRKPTSRRLTADELREIGQTLWGGIDMWKVGLTNALALKDHTRVRDMLSGRKPVIERARERLVALLRQRGAAALALADRLEREE